jgi:hypothetical protein
MEEIEKMDGIMKAMGSLLNSGQPMFSVNYLKKMLGLSQKEERMRNIESIFKNEFQNNETK